MKQSRLHTVAYGRVQGVGFREFVRHHATRLGLAGYVRNRTNGTVQLEAAGDPDDLQQLLTLLATGPRHSHVERLEQLTPGTDELPFPFTIHRTA